MDQQERIKLQMVLITESEEQLLAREKRSKEGRAEHFRAISKLQDEEREVQRFRQYAFPKKTQSKESAKPVSGSYKGKRLLAQSEVQDGVKLLDAEGYKTFTLTQLSAKISQHRSELTMNKAVQKRILQHITRLQRKGVLELVSRQTWHTM